MSQFEGKIALVTGASSGIGQAVALLLASRGAQVVAIARREERLEALRRECENIHPQAADVTDHRQLERIVTETVRAHRQIDIVVNNAGASFYERLLDSTLENWRRTLETNVESMFALTKLVVPHMIERRYGRIVNVSSIQAKAAEPMVGAYAASKGAIDAWSRSLAVDLAEYGILVNVVSPGCIRTEMSVINGIDETETEEFRQWYVERRRIPLARPGASHEVAAAIAFLSGDECTYITGHTLVVDGGLTITF
ncbi:SDR family oxidoreductase [Blastopirellula sp. J2-11]|uniref:SDR family NAD(P)-dependent oxidoreductase n=1 Tax=Blastopirellula sp. J2-11 TaxID=2943192 RepID=UPI0021C919A0|nr:SDR family oxidoreductase [Blastopirellula sp. J2-11]UUO04375.1 SDR family oxidoreductase [Blastopirellula sp. J2-11]